MKYELPYMEQRFELWIGSSEEADIIMNIYMYSEKLQTETCRMFGFIYIPLSTV